MARRLAASGFIASSTSTASFSRGIPLARIKMAAKYKLRVVGAAQVVAVCCKGESVLAGARMKDIVVYQASTLLTRGLLFVPA